MVCPHCKHKKSRVTDTDNLDSSIERIRKCVSCGRPFHSTEVLRESLYRAIRRIFREGSPVCVEGNDGFCQYLAGGQTPRCEVLSKKKTPTLCRIFQLKGDWYR